MSKENLEEAIRESKDYRTWLYKLTDGQPKGEIFRASEAQALIETGEWFFNPAECLKPKHYVEAMGQKPSVADLNEIEYIAGEIAKDDVILLNMEERFEDIKDDKEALKNFKSQLLEVFERRLGKEAMKNVKIDKRLAPKTLIFKAQEYLLDGNSNGSNN